MSGSVMMSGSTNSRQSIAASVSKAQPRPRLAQSSQPDSTMAADSATASAASSMPGWNQLSVARPQLHQPRRAR